MVDPRNCKTPALFWYPDVPSPKGVKTMIQAMANTIV